MWRVIELTKDGESLSYSAFWSLRWVIGEQTLRWTGLGGIRTEREFRVCFPEDHPGAMDLISTGGPLWEGVETPPLIKELLAETTPGI
jgi:hypothetical protein